MFYHCFLVTVDMHETLTVMDIPHPLPPFFSQL